MQRPARRPAYTMSEYLEIEERANVKHEFLGGEIFAMAGGTPEHGALAARVIGLLGAGLEGKPCRVFTSDTRVRVVATGLDTYPDVAVVCGQLALDVEDRNALTNPVLLVEVTSPGTANYDRGEKRDHYQLIPSLREILIVAHDVHRIERHHRSGDVWTTEVVTAGQQLQLETGAIRLRVDDVYRNPLAG